MAGIGKLSIGLTALIFHALSSTSAQAENAPPAPVASPEVYKVVAENMDWSVIKATLQPGQEDKFHSHPADQVSLYQTDCKLRLTSLDGTSIVVSQKQGEAAVRIGQADSGAQGSEISAKKFALSGWSSRKISLEPI